MFKSLLQSRVTFKEENLLSVGQRQQRAVTDDSSLGSFNVDLNEHDADIDEFSDGLTTQDDGGESTEPEHTENTLFFGQDEEMPRYKHAKWGQKMGDISVTSFIIFPLSLTF